jgi:Na+-transporting NADH:ubiquinone oxidoreductase subunit A
LKYKDLTNNQFYSPFHHFSMRKGLTRFFILISFLSVSPYIQAQTASPGSNSMAWVLLLVVVLIAFAVIVQVADNLLRIEAKKSGADQAGANFSLFPHWKEIFTPKKPSFTGDAKVNFLKKGFEINLEGKAAKHVEAGNATTFAVQPPNFRGISPIPKMVVEAGNTVRAGDPLFHDKVATAINFVAPVSGEIIAINRGERRAITEVVILADKKQQYRELPMFDIHKSSRESLVSFLCECGAWTLIKYRPFNKMAPVDIIPDNIFISTFDTAPLAPDLNFVVEGKAEAFQAGLDCLAKLTHGKVYLGLNASGEIAPSPVFTNAQGVEKRWFHGKHPAGNVGIQIHHICPIHPKDEVWTLGVQEVITLGAIFTERRFNAERIVALTGAELKAPKYVRTYAGANMGQLLEGNLNNDHIRIVSGDVLSGEKKSADSFLNWYDDQITVMEEGDYYEMFGWLLPGKSAPSASRSFPNWIFPDTTFKADTNTQGEKRAFVVTGQYEDVLPMDIYPQHLMKAILTNDYEKMEGLGIHELVEEDVALCEFVCTSKQPLQQILRQGLDMMEEQS